MTLPVLLDRASALQPETEGHDARQRVLNEAGETNRRSAAQLARELAMAESPRPWA